MMGTAVHGNELGDSVWNDGCHGSPYKISVVGWPFTELCCFSEAIQCICHSIYTWPSSRVAPWRKSIYKMPPQGDLLVKYFDSSVLSVVAWWRAFPKGHHWDVSRFLCCHFVMGITWFFTELCGSATRYSKKFQTLNKTRCRVLWWK